MEQLFAIQDVLLAQFEQSVFYPHTPLIELVYKLYKETDVRLLCVDEIQNLNRL